MTPPPLPDAVPVVLDSAATVPAEPRPVVPDSAGALPALSGPPSPAPDTSSAVEEPPTEVVPAGPALLDVLAWIESRYASAPEIDAVRALRGALQERIAPAPAPDSTVATAEPESAPDLPAGLTGAAPINPEEGGFTWRVLTLTSEDEAVIGLAGILGSYRRAIVTDGALFYVVIGQFTTPEAAEASRGELPSRERAQAVVIPLRGFRLVRDAPVAAPRPPAPTPPGRPTEE